MMMWVMTMTMATKTQKGILTSVTYGVYKSKLVGCPAETILTWMVFKGREVTSVRAR